MAELRKITKTGAEQQDIIELLDNLSSTRNIRYNSFDPIVGTPAVTAVGGSTVGGYAFDPTSAEAITTVIACDTFFPGVDYTKDIDFVINYSTAATSGNIIWDVDYIAAGGNEDVGGAVTTLSETAGAQAVADVLYSSPVFTIPANTISSGDLLWLTVRREAADAGDTCASDAVFYGINFITYTTNPQIV
jgi:hypothetical protein